jgi:nitroreductase
MNTIETIKQRRSTRTFNNKKIKDEDIQTILECAMCAPTARNQQGFRFIVINDKNILEDIASNIEHGKMCKDASHAIVVCYEVKDELSKLYWTQDASASTQNILLSATDLGIGSVWVAVHPRETKVNFVTNYFKLPQTIKPLCIVALGYKDEFLKEVNRFDKSKIWYNCESMI